MHSYPLPARWAARDQELADLTELVRSGQQRVLAVLAMGGTGKSALARKLVDASTDLLGRLEGGLWFSFYVEADIDRFVAEACRWLLPEFDPTTTSSPFARLTMLTQALQQRRCLLILDGIEVMLETDPQQPTFGTCKSKLLRELLTSVCDPQIRSQLLITSRLPLADLDGRAGYHELPLADLSPEAAVAFLVELGVRGTPETILEVCNHYGRHALSLHVLADYLLQAPLDGDIAGAYSLAELPEETPQGRKLQAILDGYWSRIDSSARFFMTRLAAARTAVPDEHLSMLAADDHGQPCDPEHPAFHRTLRRLRQSALLQVERHGSRHSYTAHPLIKSYFYSRLDQTDRQTIHLAWQSFLAARPHPGHPRSLEDLHGRIESYHHAVCAGRYDDAYQLYQSEGLNSWLLWWGHSPLAIQLLAPLLDAYDRRVWAPPARQISRLFGDAANHLAKAGQPAQALLYHGRAVAVAELAPTEQSRAWQYLSELLAEMGQFDEALATLRHAEQLERQLNRPHRAYLTLGRLGYYRAGLGRPPLADEQLDRAIQLARADTASALSAQGYLCLYLRVRGDLHLNTGRLSDALNDYREVLNASWEFMPHG